MGSLVSQSMTWESKPLRYGGITIGKLGTQRGAVIACGQIWGPT